MENGVNPEALAVSHAVSVMIMCSANRCRTRSINSDAKEQRLKHSPNLVYQNDLDSAAIEHLLPRLRGPNRARSHFSWQPVDSFQCVADYRQGTVASGISRAAYLSGAWTNDLSTRQLVQPVIRDRLGQQMERDRSQCPTQGIFWWTNPVHLGRALYGGTEYSLRNIRTAWPRARGDSNCATFCLCRTVEGLGQDHWP